MALRKEDAGIFTPEEKKHLEGCEKMLDRILDQEYDPDKVDWSCSVSLNRIRPNGPGIRITKVARTLVYLYTEAGWTVSLTEDTSSEAGCLIFQ